MSLKSLMIIVVRSFLLLQTLLVLDHSVVNIITGRHTSHLDTHHFVVVGLKHFRSIDVLNNYRYNHNKNNSNKNNYNKSNDTWKKNKNSSIQSTTTDQNVNDGDDDDTIGNNTDVQELYVTQKLDHFNPSNYMYTFQQRYFYSNRFVNQDETTTTTATSVSDKNNITQQQIRNIAFLCIGGEGPYLDKSVLINSVHCTGDMLYSAETIINTMKSSINIHLFALEHRYYGESYPQQFPPSSSITKNSSNNTTVSSSSPVSNEHLVYHSSRQALADVAHFISNPLYSHYEWIIFGASYPGVLAAWTKYHYSHLNIVGAISNSAPVQSVLDMSVYNNHVSKVLQDPTVGGSPLCHYIYSVGHEQLGMALAPANNSSSSNSSKTNRTYEIATRLQLCNVTALDDIKNIQQLIGDGVLDLNTQENDPSCEHEYCNIEKICLALIDHYTTNQTTTATNTSSSTEKEMDTLIDVTNLVHTARHKHQSNNNNNSYCTIADWEGTIQYISDPILGMENGLRSWLWQTCTEFGFYQTCETTSNCPFAKGYHLLDQDLEICTRAFHIPAQAVPMFVQETIVWSGGWNIAHSDVTNIVSITGTIDPWSELSLQPISNNNTATTNSSSMPTYQVHGASHHFWTHPIKVSDGPDIVAVREFIYNTVRNTFLKLNTNNEQNDQDQESVDTTS